MSERQKVALVITPSPFLADERVFPSLGPLKVASSLEAGGHSVDVLDLSGIRNFPEVVTRYMGTPDRAKVIGVSATTPQFPQAVRVLEAIKQADPETKVILGGAHATMVGSAYKLDQSKGVEYRGTHGFKQMTSMFDTIVIGDGEEAIFEAIKPDSGLVVDAGERISPLFLQRGTLEQYPFPNRDLIDFKSYHYTIDGKEAQSMIAQLGCPFECGFCGGRNTPSFRVARRRSPESVVEEVEILTKKYNKRGIMFYDDELNISDQGLTEMLEALIHYQEKENMDLSFRGFVKAELFLPKQAELMYRAGFRVLLSGVESGDDSILKTMRKHTTRIINTIWVNNCHAAGIEAKALMSIGHPGESEQTINNTLEWVLSNKPDDVDFTIITEYPGSPYFDKSAPHPNEEGVWVYEDDRTKEILYSRDVNYAEKAEYYKGIPGDYTSYVWTDHLSPEELVKNRDRVEDVCRKALNLPTIQSVASMQFEHSMGQRTLPTNILRSTKG